MRILLRMLKTFFHKGAAVDEKQVPAQTQHNVKGMKTAL